MGLFKSDGLRIGFLGDFDVIKTARAFDVRAVGANNNHDVAPIRDDGVELGLIELIGSGEINGVGVVIFDLDVVFAGFEVRAEGAARCNNNITVFGGTKLAGEGGHGELLKGFFKGDGFFGLAFGERGEARLFAGGFLVVAELDEAAVTTDFGVDRETGLGIFA